MYCFFYGEMISYVFMSGGIAFFSTITWIKHPYKEHQVKVERLTVKKLIFMLCTIFSIVIPRTVHTTTATNTANTGGSPRELAIKKVI